MSKKGYGHGGYREGSGGKFKYGVPTKQRRIPITISDEVLDKLIRDYLKAHNLTETDTKS